MLRLGLPKMDVLSKQIILVMKKKMRKRVRKKWYTSSIKMKINLSLNVLSLTVIVIAIQASLSVPDRTMAPERNYHVIVHGS